MPRAAASRSKHVCLPSVARSSRSGGVVPATSIARSWQRVHEHRRAARRLVQLRHLHASRGRRPGGDVHRRPRRRPVLRDRHGDQHRAALISRPRTSSCSRAVGAATPLAAGSRSPDLDDPLRDLRGRQRRGDRHPQGAPPRAAAQAARPAAGGEHHPRAQADLRLPPPRPLGRRVHLVDDRDRRDEQHRERSVWRVVDPARALARPP